MLLESPLRAFCRAIWRAQKSGRVCGDLTGTSAVFNVCVQLYSSRRRNSRIETLMTYAQSVYLLFASVYVCKETVEHLLLSSGEGHHHHHGDEFVSITGYAPHFFPPTENSWIILASSFHRYYYLSHCYLSFALLRYSIAKQNLLVVRILSPSIRSANKLTLYVSNRQLHPSFTLLAPVPVAH